MKYILRVILLIILMAFSFTGCKKEKEASAEKDNTFVDEKASDQTSNTEQDSKAEQQENSMNTGQLVPTVAEQEELSPGITIEEQILVDQDGIRIAVLAYENPGEQIILSVKNSREENVEFSADVLSVNDLMSFSGVYDRIEAGTEKQLRLQLSPSDIDYNYTENITTFDIKFKAENVTSEKIETILETEPFIINTSLKGKYEQEYDASGMLLYDENELRITYQGINEDHPDYTRMKLFIENDSDKALHLTLYPEPGNLIPEDLENFCKVLPGKKTYAGFILKEEVFRNLSEFDLKFKVYEENEYTYLRGPDFLYETDTKTIPINLE